MLQPVPSSKSMRTKNKPLALAINKVYLAKNLKTQNYIRMCLLERQSNSEIIANTYAVLPHSYHNIANITSTKIMPQNWLQTCDDTSKEPTYKGIRNCL